MDFATALKQMRNGSKLTRTLWGDAQRLVEIRTNAVEGTLQEYEYFVRYDVLGANIGRTPMPYDPTTDDILAYDWEFPR